MRRLALLAVLSLVGCVTRLPPPVALPAPAPVAEVERPTPLPTTDVPLLDEPGSAYPVVATIERAMRQARRTPTPAQFSRGMLWYTFEQPSPVYRLDVAQDTFSTIILAPGEQLHYVGLADTKRWAMDETIVGEGETRRIVVLIKPTSEQAKRTTMVLTTSFGMYHIEIYANKSTYVPAIAWKHPERVAAAPPPPLPISSVRYQMRVMTTPAPAWTPTAAWDNGRKTFVRCADALEVTQTPALYVLPADPDAEAEMVNYDIKGTTYVVHRLLGPGEVFELKLGDGEAIQSVRVERQEVHDARRP